MAKVILKDLKKVYPNTEKKKKIICQDQEKSQNLLKCLFAVLLGAM